MVSHRAGLLTSDHKKKLKGGEIKTIMDFLCVNHVKKPDDISDSNWKILKAKVITDTWEKLGVEGISKEQIEENVK